MTPHSGSSASGIVLLVFRASLRKVVRGRLVEGGWAIEKFQNFENYSEVYPVPFGQGFGHFL
jgi:hypothetical protein